MERRRREQGPKEYSSYAVSGSCRLHGEKLWSNEQILRREACRGRGSRRLAGGAARLLHITFFSRLIFRSLVPFRKLSQPVSVFVASSQAELPSKAGMYNRLVEDLQASLALVREEEEGAEVGKQPKEVVGQEGTGAGQQQKQNWLDLSLTGLKRKRKVSIVSSKI